MKITALLLLLLVPVVHGQVYAEPEYANDNLYHDYAMRQQEKEAQAVG